MNGDGIIVNQEDSIVFNKTSLDRGMFISTSFNKYSSIIQKNQSTAQNEIFMKPDDAKVYGLKTGSYDKLNNKGYVPEETVVVNGDFLIGKVVPVQATNENSKPYRDNSESYKQHVPGVVDKVYSDIHNVDGYEMKKIKVRSQRIPNIGDKMCCYDPSHDILTTDGWIPIDKVTIKHKVACLTNGDTLSYCNPIDIQTYDYEGDMYVVDSNQVKLKVTPNHRMYVGNSVGENFEIIEAKYIFNKCRSYIKNIVRYFDKEQCMKKLHNIILKCENDYFETTSKKNADDLQILCLHSGYSANIVECGEGNSYKIIVNTTINKQIINNLCNEDRYEKYIGKVHCCTVPNDGIIYVRRDGCPVWCGNSRHG